MATADAFTDWSRRLRSSDPRAFTELFEATHTGLLRYAWRYTGDENAARDVVQDAYLKLWHIRATLDPGRSLKALLYTIVRNLALNHNRAAQHHAAPTADPDTWQDRRTAGADSEVEAGLLGERIRRWIAAMPERRREAFLLSRFHGLTHEEIAHIMNLTPRTVNTHIVLALKDLRNKLGTLEPDHRAP